MPTEEDVGAAMIALRRAESGNYRSATRVATGGTADYKVGAYGILESKWAALAAAAGYPGADWRDPRAQDSVVRKRVMRDMEHIEQTYPEAGADIAQMAAVSFRFGIALTDQLLERSLVTPEAMRSVEGLAPVADYVGSITKGMKFSGRTNPSRTTQTSEKTPSLTRAEGIVRDRLVSMRDIERGRRAANGNNEELEQVGDQDVPAVAE